MPVIQSIDYAAIAPPVVVALSALGVLVTDAFLPPGWRWLGGYAALAGIAGAFAADAALAAGGGLRRTFCIPPGLRAGGPSSCSYVVDEFTLLLHMVVLVAAAVVVLMARSETRASPLPTGEFHFLLLASVAGALTLAASRDLVTLVVSLELVSLPVFALAALRRYDGRSSEAGLTMFLVSVVSTAVTLLGISLVYGVTGAMHLDRIAAALARPEAAHPVTAVAIVLVLVGLGFKVSAVPFHFWAPDTYEGAPVPIAAFLSVVSKAAGFAGLVLVLSVGFSPYAAVWGPLVAVLAGASMTVGNLVALRQRRAVRLLAWSSIAHAGYMLVPLGAVAGVAGTAGFAPGGGSGTASEIVAATVGYVAIYAAMTIGAFAVVVFVDRHWGRGDLGSYRGLVRAHPLLAVALAFFLACLAGLPPGLAGLFAKIIVFRAAVAGAYGWLAVLMAVNTVLGLYYYLGWAVQLFRPLPEGVPGRPGRVPRPVGVAVAIAAAGTVVLSLVPQLVLDVTPAAVSALGG